MSNNTLNGRGKTPIIKTENLSKRYGSRVGKVALEDLNLEVYPGEIFGYLGPNGAGKTTTIRILMDLIRPTTGKASLFGMDARESAVEIHKRIGFLPGELNLWQGQTARSIIRYMAAVRGDVDMKYVEELADRLDFDMSKRIRDHSTGNKRKMGLILALMHKPELLILDEPTSGLDPLMQQAFIELMREWRDAGRTVFLSSHMLSEVQAICDRVAILRAGKLQAVETVTRLTSVDFRWITVRFRDAASASMLSGISGVSDVSIQDNLMKLRLTGDFDPLMRAISQQYVEDLRVSEPTLEEVFLTYYGDEQRAHNGAVKERV
jgi:ABC-2 type transport system ATP-binding protein